jgi:hypothetical protein
MTVVRHPVAPQVRENNGANKAEAPRSDKAGQGGDGSNVVAHLGTRQPRDTAADSNGRGRNSGGGQGRPGTQEVAALAEALQKITPSGIQRVVKNAGRAQINKAIPWQDNPLHYIGPKAVAAAYNSGSLRRPMFSQPLPGALGANAKKNCGVFISPQLRKKLEPYLKKRPSRGFGYIIARGDVLDDLLDEAYDDSEGGDDESRTASIIAAFLEYNRHLGLSGPEALNAAVGQLLFFPELQELLSMKETLARGASPANFPAIEVFLDFAGMPASAAPMFHWVAPRMPASDANLTTSGKPFAFQTAGYTPEKRFEPQQSDIPKEWVKEQLQAGLYRAQLNRDHQYNEDLVMAGRYNHVRA